MAPIGRFCTGRIASGLLRARLSLGVLLATMHCHQRPTEAPDSSAPDTDWRSYSSLPSCQKNNNNSLRRNLLQQSKRRKVREEKNFTSRPANSRAEFRLLLQTLSRPPNFGLQTLASKLAANKPRQSKEPPAERTMGGHFRPPEVAQ